MGIDPAFGSSAFRIVITQRADNQIQIMHAEDLSPDNNTEANAATIVDEAEKLYSKLVKDCINKVIIIDYTFSKPSSLPLLPPSNEEQQRSYEIKPKSGS